MIVKKKNNTNHTDMQIYYFIRIQLILLQVGARKISPKNAIDTRLCTLNAVVLKTDDED